MIQPPLSLYVHFPWCVKKCPYCDFNSHTTSRLDEPGYLNALIRDLDFECTRLPPSPGPLQSIFFGGGTPSLFSPRSFDTLIDEIGARLPVSADAEITMEANPGTTEHASFSDYRASGINRLSLGVQSFNNLSLSLLGRIHNADQASQAFRQARDGGFDNINLDLMYGLPNQTADEALDDLSTALALEPEHLSLYQLTLEPNTVFHRYPPALPDGDQVFNQQQTLQHALTEAGYAQYEVSAYSRPGFQCRHNLNYWRFGDYLGIGAGGHGKYTAENRIVRRARKKHPATFLELAGSEDAVATTEWIPEADRIGEFMMNALRLRDGFERSLPKHHADIDDQSIENALSDSIQSGLIKMDDRSIRCTDRGYLFLDSILETLI